MTNTYYTENRTSILAQQKQYRELNREYRNAQKLEHYELNKEAIEIKKGIVIQCECGRTSPIQSITNKDILELKYITVD